LGDKEVVGVFVSSFRFFAYLFNELYVSSAEAEVTLSPFSTHQWQLSTFSVTPGLLIFATLLLEAKWPINAQWKQFIIHFLRNIFSFIQGGVSCSRK
jgi:hypothetical protein